MQSRHNIFELGNGFPTRHGTTVFLTGRKLFANGFLFVMALLCFLPTGNCLRRVSYSTWHYCASLQQETVRERFPIRHSNTVFHCDRKLFAKGFLFDLAPPCFLPTGNYSPGDFSTSLEMTWEAWQYCVSCRQETVCERVSCSTWYYCVSCRQETICEGVPVRHDTTVFHRDKKLFAKGFLLDMALLCFLPAGNCLRIVSYSTWHYCVSYRQETICEGFPVRHGTIVFLTDRKLFAKGFLVVMAPLCFLPTGNYSPGDFSTPLEMTGGMAAMGFSTTVSGQQTADSGQSGPQKRNPPA